MWARVRATVGARRTDRIAESELAQRIIASDAVSGRTARALSRAYAIAAEHRRARPLPADAVAASRECGGRLASVAAGCGWLRDVYSGKWCDTTVPDDGGNGLPPVGDVPNREVQCCLLVFHLLTGASARLCIAHSDPMPGRV
jgi:hypothetical protein